MKKPLFLSLISLFTFQTHYGMNSTNDSEQKEVIPFERINPIEIITNLLPDLQLKIVAIADPEVKNTLAVFNTAFNAFASKKNYRSIITQNPLWIGEKDKAGFMRIAASEPDGLPVIDALLKNGIHPDPKDRILDMSPLEIATQYGHTDIVQRLKEAYPKGERIIIDKSKKIPVTVMDLYKGKKYIAERLIKKEIDYYDLAHPTINSTFITCAAAYLGHIEIISYFRQECSYIFMPIEVGTSTGTKESYAPNYAAQGGYKNILIELSLFYKDKTSQITNFRCAKYAPIHWACSTGSNKAVIWLIENGADTSQKTTEKEDTLLHIAARYGHTHTLQLLLEKYKFNINKINQKGETPLNLACKKGHYNAVAFLLEKKTLTLSLYKTRSCLHNAAQSGNLSIVKLLLPNLETNIDHRDDEEQTALLIAAENHHADIVKYLIKKEANQHLTNKYEENALHLAASAGFDGYGLLNENALFDTVQILINNNVTINAQDTFGNTPLHNAVTNNYIEVVRLLLNNSVDTTIENDNHETPLDIATELDITTESDYTEIIELLTNHNS